MHGLKYLKNLLKIGILTKIEFINCSWPDDLEGKKRKSSEIELTIFKLPSMFQSKNKTLRILRQSKKIKSNDQMSILKFDKKEGLQS